MVNNVYRFDIVVEQIICAKLCLIKRIARWAAKVSVNQVFNLYAVDIQSSRNKSM